MANNRTTLTIKEIKTLKHSSRGYYGNGVFPQVDSYFYWVKDEEGTVYTISTTKKLFEGDVIIASIKGHKTFRGENQISLTRVSILEPSPNRPSVNDYDYLKYISTDGENY